MPYVALEDVGTTKRRSLSGRRRLEVWEKTGGTCILCDRRIDGVRERWIVEHIRALELGGMDDIDNMGPAHEACGREKTLDDHARAAEAKRQKIRHLGAVVVTRPLPGSRTSALKRKVDGTVVLRADPLRASADTSSTLGQGRVVRSNPMPFPVDAAMKPKDRLCLCPTPSDKESEAGTVNPMKIRQRPARRQTTDNTAGDAIYSGEMVPEIPAHLDFLFAERPLLPGEDADQYDALLRSIVKQVKPVDVIEAIWVKDVIDLIWEAKRLRRWRRQILVQARLEAAENLIRQARDNISPILRNSATDQTPGSLAAGWATNKQIEKAEVETMFSARGITSNDVDAHGFLLSLPAIERIDRLVSMADHRRDALLREIERKRASFGEQVRRATANTIDADGADIS
ncbi:HNH endonuclease signature motif containing protein [Methylobacterium sp. CM6246]